MNQMFGQTVNRCHATPIVECSPITMNHAMEMMIFTAEITTIAASRTGTGSWTGSRNHVVGK